MPPAIIPAWDAPSPSFKIHTLELWLFQLRQPRQRTCMKAPSMEHLAIFLLCILADSLRYIWHYVLFPARTVGSYFMPHDFQPTTCWPCCPHTKGSCPVGKPPPQRTSPPLLLVQTKRRIIQKASVDFPIGYDDQYSSIAAFSNIEKREEMMP